MIDLPHLLALIGFGLVLWAWRDNLRARELAMAAARRACKRSGFQLLDQTVMIRRVSLGRRRDGVLRIRRTYSFEFSSEGADRNPGQAILVGQQLISIQLDPPAGLVVSDEKEPPQKNPPGGPTP